MKKYFDHYISLPDAAIFFGLALAGILITNLIIYLYSLLRSGGKKKEGCCGQDQPACRKYLSVIQRFYELIFSGTSILFFLTVYYLIDRFYTEQPYKGLFVKYESFWLLLLIVLSCVLNAILDRGFARLGFLKKDERGAVRIVGMVYVMLIFAYIKFIYENDNYDLFITYFLGLMIGRFVYFDASFGDFVSSVGKAALSAPLLIFSLGCTAGLSYYGFTTKYLIKHIGVLTNVFILHLFLCIAIILVFHLHPERLFFGAGKPAKPQTDASGGDNAGTAEED